MFEFIFFIIALLVSITIHEFAHALAADKLGDPTPRVNGRLTLNPLAHLDPLGTLALLIFHFGWGKPVPIDPFNLKNPRRDAALISLAGPGSNFVLASLLALPLRFIPLFPLVAQFLVILVTINIALGLFNLLPVPPLDGGSILLGFIPRELALEWEDILNQYGPIILILLILPISGQPMIARILLPIMDFILNLLLS